MSGRGLKIDIGIGCISIDETKLVVLRSLATELHNNLRAKQSSDVIARINE